MDFFLLYRITPNREQYLTVSSMEEQEALRMYMRGDSRPNAPVPMEIHNTKKVDMFLCAGHFLATEKVLQLLRNNGITGWETYDVKVTNSKPGTPAIFGLIFRGRLGPYIPDWTIKLSTWDGADFCTFEKGYSPVVTSTVMNIFQRENIRGVYSQQLSVIP